GRPATILSRILEEGYGEGAWHGPDLESAVADVTPEDAFRRPAPARHNVAEIALHHAWYVRSVAERLTGTPQSPFPLEGEDWFALDGGDGLSWEEVKAELARRQQELVRTVATLNGRAGGAEGDFEAQLDLVLGITCHAVYHAGQIQLVKRLIEG
ncbi:MAG TPA: DinB family protein, partial [Longimicrobiales bacterium]|nr:DinB family protein [Longimicrobiales bacterium]